MLKAHLRIWEEALAGRDLFSPNKSSRGFHKCIDGTFSLQILGQVPPCLFDCSAGKILVYLLLDLVCFVCRVLS